MDQLVTELDFNVVDFTNQIEQPGTPTALSSHYVDADDGESALGSSGDGVPAFGPSDEIVFAEKVPTNTVAEDATAMTVEDTTATTVEDTTETAVEDTTAMTVEAELSVPVKRKRGRPRKNPEAPPAPLVKKKERENVCFVCFDRTNPNLVSCDRRGCYKAYHPACVNRDDDFFHSKVKWNCGWHICSNCQKAAHYMCYTCTTSYCKECITHESKYVCVRGSYGFCQSCHNTVTLIELNKLTFETKDGSDVDDTDSFTYLFKAYWLEQKGRLSLTSEELSNARHPCSVALDEESSDELYDVNEDHGSSSESSSGRHKRNISSKKKTKNRFQVFTAEKVPAKEVDGGFTTEKFPVKEADGGGTVILQETGWASKELLELVTHMRNGDQSFISQFEVQALLLDYIKKYNLRDPRRKSQIICDLRLRNLFGKDRVGHFEMLKLLELHFLSKEVPQVFEDGDQVEASDTDNRPTDDVEEGDTFSRLVSEKRRKSRKRIEELEPQINTDDYAAVDVHNVTQIFLRRSLVEELLDDIETFNDNVVGSFVRIRISNAGQRQDLYRLVQVVGTQENPKLYKVGKKTTAIVLEILNLDKKETSTIDSISNQDFTEEECQRLRQSIKCGLIDRLKVGYIQEKAKALHAVRVKDSIEAEKLRLSHLRDRASETGRRKQLRECVEKLQLLNSPEERRRRLNEFPQVHADPKMDPGYESPEETVDVNNQDFHIKSKESSSLKKRKELIPRGRSGSNWNGMHKSPNFNHESRNMPGEVVQQDRLGVYNNMAEKPNEPLLGQTKELPPFEPNFTDLQSPSPKNFATTSLEQRPRTVAPEINSETQNEIDKIWHYVDPSNNIQGPFSLTQLRKWSTTGYFPPDMRIWRTSEKQEDSCLLSDILSGRFYTQHSSFSYQQNRGNTNINQPTSDGLPSQPPVWSTPGVEMPNPGIWPGNPRPSGPVYNNSYHNPTYEETGRRGGSSGGWNPEQDYGNMWSPTRPRENIEGNLMPDPSSITDTPISHEQNIGMKTYRSFESDCPSPTPRTENMEVGQGFGATIITSDSCLASQPVSINFEPSNTGSTEGKSFSSELPNISEDMGIRKLETGQVMDHSSFQKPPPIVSNLTPSLDQVQNPNPNFSPIHQLNPQGAIDSSLPSPTPKISNNAGGVDPSIPVQAVQNANASWGGTQQGNLGWGPVANPGWGAPGQMASNINPGLGVPIQMNQNTNMGWAPPLQVNTNAGWGMPPLQVNANVNTGWVAPVQANTNENTGWGVPVQVNANGWGTMDAVRTHDDDPNVRAGRGSSYGNKNGGWKSSDGDTSRRFDHGDGYPRHRDTGRHGHGGNDSWNNRSLSGGKGGSSQAHQVPPGVDRQRGVCKFFENGHCKKGRYCTFLHIETKRDIR